MFVPNLWVGSLQFGFLVCVCCWAAAASLQTYGDVLAWRYVHEMKPLQSWHRKNKDQCGLGLDHPTDHDQRLDPHITDCGDFFLFALPRLFLESPLMSGAGLGHSARQPAVTVGQQSGNASFSASGTRRWRQE
uniref:Putative secreted protein n=1 Tax=Amblyomma parvum TaxID=251391 RepID=A0A023G0H8_AMBPA